MDDPDDLRYLIFKQRPDSFSPKVAKFKVGKLRSEKEFENDRARKRSKNPGFRNFETLQVASEKSRIENALLVTFHNAAATDTQVAGNSVVKSDNYSVSAGSFDNAQHSSYSDDNINISHGPNSARKEPVRKLKRKYDRHELNKDLHYPFRTKNALAGRIPLFRRRVSVKSDTVSHSEHNAVLDYVVSSESEVETVVGRSHDASQGIIQGMSSLGYSEAPVCQDTSSVSLCASVVGTFEKGLSPDQSAGGIKSPEKLRQNIERPRKIKLNRRSILNSSSDAERNPDGKTNICEQPQLQHGDVRMLSIRSLNEANCAVDSARSLEELRREERLKRFGVLDEKALAKPDQSISSKPQTVTLATNVGSPIPRSEKRVGRVIKLDGIATEEHLQLKGNEVVKLNLSLQTDLGNGRLKKRSRSSPINIILEPSSPICESAAVEFSSNVVQDNAITSSDPGTSEDYSTRRFDGAAEKILESRVAAESAFILPHPSDHVKLEVQSPGTVFGTAGSVGVKDDGPYQMGLAERILNREKAVIGSSDLVERGADILKPGSKRNADKRHKSEARANSHVRVDGAGAVLQANDSRSSDVLRVTAEASVNKSDATTANRAQEMELALFDSKIGPQTIATDAVLPVATAVPATSSSEIAKTWVSTLSRTPLGLSDGAVLDSKDRRAENPSLTNVPGPNKDEAVKNYVSKTSKGSGAKSANKKTDKGRVRNNKEQRRLNDDSKAKKKSRAFESSHTKGSVTTKKHATQSLSKKRRFSSSSESSFSTSASSDSDSRSSSSYSSSGSESDYETDSSSSGSSTDTSGSTSSTSSYSSESDRKGKRSRKAKDNALAKKSRASKGSKASSKTASVRQKSVTGHSLSLTLPDRGSRGKVSAGTAEARRKAAVMANRLKVEGNSTKVVNVGERSLKESSKGSSQKSVDSLQARSTPNNTRDERNGRSSMASSGKPSSSHDSRGFHKSHSPVGKRSSASNASAKKLPHASSTGSHKT